MNKRRNKSVTKTKHRVQKTKRSRRLNKNRSVKGIRGNNKTKVVGKRRNIVQRGGGRIDDLVGRIYGLNKIEGEIPESFIDTIMADVTVENTQQRTQIEKPDGSLVNDGTTLLYAASRLNRPSPYLVSKILEKTQDQHTGTSMGSVLKKMSGKERSSTWNRIIPNGSSNGSYPQHGAVQAAREILEKCSIRDDVTAYNKLNEIIKILKLLKEYDAKVPKLTGDMTPLMKLPNKLRDGEWGFTAYQEFTLSFGGANSVEGLIKSKLPTYAVELVRKFEEVLEKPKHVFAPPPPGKSMGGNSFAYGSEGW
jgi:hypothetical protein